MKSEFLKKLEEYFAELALTKEIVPYNRIAFLLLSIPGVDNFTALTINKTTENLTIPNGFGISEFLHSWRTSGKTNVPNKKRGLSLERGKTAGKPVRHAQRRLDKGGNLIWRKPA